METLIQSFVQAFGWSIINSLWQSALIYGVLFILLISFPKLAARLKHNLAFASILLMFGCFLYNFFSQLLTVTQLKNNVAGNGNLSIYPYINNVPQSLSSKIEQYFPLVVLFYIIGILLQLLVIGKGYIQLSKFRKNSLSNVPDEWRLIFGKVTAQLRINKNITFHLSAIINVPLVIGYLKPVVLFPVALVNQLDNDQVEAILIHELSHIRRNDFLLNLIKTAIETFLFYNPFVWMAGRFIHIEREHACDDLVLKATGKPLNYAQALLKLELLKEKSSPAYALAATGKTQNLYQRIKRITNMKTNYLNAKQQMAALTLGIACLFSIAWINPAEKKAQKISNHAILQIKPSKNGNMVMYLDTTKKRKVQIITIDAGGKKTVYNSLNEMPDSLKKDSYLGELFDGKHAFMYNSDSALKFKDSILLAKINRQFNSPEAQAKWKKLSEDMAKQYNSPEAQAKWKKFGEDVAKQYNSPEAQAKWKKFGEDVAKQYNSPEAQAKWKKFGEDVAKQYNSPEAQAKWKKFGEDIAKQYNSPEAQAKWKKFGEDIAKEYNSPEAQAKWQKMAENISSQMSAPEFTAQIVDLSTQMLKNLDLSKISKGLNPDSLIKGNRNMITGSDGSIFYFNENGKQNRLKNSEEYKKLKEKFNKDVLELENKMKQEKLEIKEKPEHTEKLKS